MDDARSLFAGINLQVGEPDKDGADDPDQGPDGSSGKGFVYDGVGGDKVGTF